MLNCFKNKNIVFGWYEGFEMTNDHLHLNTSYSSILIPILGKI